MRQVRQSRRDLRFEAKDVLKRIEKFGDLMAPLVVPQPRAKKKD